MQFQALPFPGKVRFVVEPVAFHPARCDMFCSVECEEETRGELQVGSVRKKHVLSGRPTWQDFIRRVAIPQSNGLSSICSVHDADNDEILEKFISGQERIEAARMQTRISRAWMPVAACMSAGAWRWRRIRRKRRRARWWAGPAPSASAGCSSGLWGQWMPTLGET